MEQNKRTLLGMTITELKELTTELGMPAFSAKQIAQWIYVKKVRSFNEMTNLSIAHRQKLEESCQIGLTEPTECQRSVDGTAKYLFPTQNGGFVETVYIPDGERATLCVSSQIGCKMGCHFCMTGKQGFNGHLSATDILNQIYAIPESDQLTNIVFMGQGEPMDNLDNVLRTLEIVTAPYALAWSPRRITVSSVGLEKGLRRFLDESEAHLAISLHTPFAEQRAQLMPAEKAWPVTEMIELLRNYDFSHQRRLSFEYTVFGSTNDSLAHAKALVRLLKGLDCQIGRASCRERVYGLV